MSEADAVDIASGYVPTHVKAQLREMLRWREEDQARAARPVRSQSATARGMEYQAKKAARREG